jgi:hypothetical protein
LLINRKARGKLVKYLLRVNIFKLLLFMHHVELEPDIKKGASLRGIQRTTSVKLQGC